MPARPVDRTCRLFAGFLTHQARMRLPQDAWGLRDAVQQCQEDGGQGERAAALGSRSRQDLLMPPLVGRQPVDRGLQPLVYGRPTRIGRTPHAPFKDCMAVEGFYWEDMARQAQSFKWNAHSVHHTRTVW